MKKGSIKGKIGKENEDGKEVEEEEEKEKEGVKKGVLWER